MKSTVPVLALVLGDFEVTQPLWTMPTRASSPQEVWPSQKMAPNFSSKLRNKEIALIESEERKKERRLDQKIRNEISHEEEMVVHEDMFISNTLAETTDPAVLFENFSLASR